MQLRPSQFEDLRKLSKQKRVSLSELVRQAVDGFITSSRAAESPPQWSGALASLGKYHSARHDISQEHDVYLAEAFSDEGV